MSDLVSSEHKHCWNKIILNFSYLSCSLSVPQGGLAHQVADHHVAMATRYHHSNRTKTHGDLHLLSHKSPQLSKYNTFPLRRTINRKFDFRSHETLVRVVSRAPKTHRVTAEAPVEFGRATFPSSGTLTVIII